jgi:DNA-binding NarL/FixJ family response regulator
MTMETQKRKLHIQVMVVDDHPLMREGIISQVGLGQGIKVVGDASNGRELLEKLKKMHVDVILLDLQMPDMNGPQTLMRLQKKFPRIKVLVLSMFNEKRMIREMFRLGAHGYATKDIAAEQLIDAIYNVYYRGVHAADETTRSILQEVQQEKANHEEKPTQFEELKDRDHTVLGMICEGLSSEEIAPRLNLSKHTIDLCRARLIAHFDARNVVHLVSEAIRTGFYIPKG